MSLAPHKQVINFRATAKTRWTDDWSSSSDDDDDGDGGNKKRKLAKSKSTQDTIHEEVLERQFLYSGGLHERLARVDVDVHRRGEAHNFAATDFMQSYFVAALHDVRFRVSTADFVAFDARVRKFNSLPRVMLYRREIADALAAAASLPDATWNDHLPSLIAALARDTQLEFVPLFDDVLAETLIKMLDTTSAALLEALFSCWGFLFKYLQRHFVTSISDLFLRIERLFAHRREHVRRFIAQGFAFLVRKLPRGDIDDDDDDDDDIDEDNDESGKKATKSTAVANGAVPLVEFWRFVRSRVALSKHVSVGVAQLLLETWRSTANRFHSRAADMLGLALEVARDAQDVDPAELVAWRACLDDAFTHSMSHGRAEPANASFFLTQLCAELDVAVKSGAAADANGTWLPTTLAMWSRKKQQRFLTNLDPLVDRLTGKNGALSVGVLSAQWQSRERVDASLLLARTLIIGSEARDGSRMAIAKSQDHVLGALMPSLASTVVLRASVLASIDTFLETAGRVLGEKRVRRAVVQHVRSAVVTLSSLLAAERESLTLLHWLAGVLPYISDNDTPLDGLEPALQCALLALRTPLGASSSVRDILLVDAGLRCHKLAHVSSTTSRGGSSFLTLACATADRVAALLADEHCAAPQRVLLAPVLEQACAACEALVPTPRELRALLEPRVDSFLTVIEQTSMPREPTTLRAVARALECCVSAACTSPIDSERVARITSLLAPELSRSTPMARISTSQCIAALLRLSDASDADLEAQVAVFEALVLLETTKFDRTTSRVGSVKLKSLETVLGNADLPSERREAALHGAFGVYFIRFAEFWGIATELLVAAAHTDLDLFWRVVWPRVQSVSSDALTSVGDALALDSASAVSAAAAAQYAERVHVTENRTSDDVYVKEAWSMLLKVGTPLSGKADEVVDFILQFGEQVHVVLRDAFNRELAAVAPTRVDDDNDAEAEADADADVDEPMDDNNNDDDDEDSAESVDAVSPILATDAVKKLGRVALCKSLELFATFRDVGAVEKRDDVCELLLRYVSRPESDLQLASFKCLLLFKPRSFADIAEPLRYLVSGSLRNALSEWRNRLDRSTGLVPAAERDEVLSLMSRLLIGRLLALKGGSGKNKYHDMATRSLVFGFVGGLDLHETWAFVELLFAPVAGAFTRTLALDVAAEARCDGALRRVPHQERELTVELMRQIFKTLPALVNERFAFFGSLLLALLRVATRRKYSQSRRRTAQYRFLSDCHSRVRELMVRYGEHADIHVLVHRWLALTTPGALERNANHGWSQFRCVLLLSETPALVAEYLATPPALALVHAALGTLGASETNATQRSDVLELIENLLKACRIDAGAALGALQPHISTLVRVLRGAVERRNELVLPADMRMSSERVKQLTARFARRQLYVLSRVAAYVSDAADAVPLVELLLPFLHAHEARSSVIDVLGTVATLLSNVPPPIVEMFAASAQTLFSAVEWARPVRDALTRSFTAAAATGALPSLGAVAPLLVRLNAFSDERLDESDYEVQSVALRELSELSVCNMIAAMPRFALPPVLHTLLQLMRGDNLSLRVAATACVCVFVSALARDDADLAVTVVSEFPRGSDEWHAARTDAVHGVIFGAVLDALQRRPVAVRSGFHRVLGALVEHWPNEYGDMSALCAPISASVPVDFFEAIVGVQSSQLLALGALATGAKQWLPERVTSLFVPLLHRMILDADAKRNGLLGTHLLRTLGALVARLDWPHYLQVLRRMLDAAATDAAHQSMLMSSVCTVLDSFRFDNRLGEQQGAAAADAADAAAPPKFAHNDVQAGMLEEVLPMLYSLLGSKRVMRASLIASAKVRAGGKKAVDEEMRGDAFVAIAEATVKVLMLLPSQLLRAELPMLLTRLVSRLNEREFDARDAARTALCGLCAAIGPTYVAQVVHELRTSLLRGFQQHVLGYTLHSILLRLQQSGAKPGDIDPAIEDIVTILLENIVGRVAAEKTVGAVAAATREAKENRALPAFRLLAQMIDFERSIVRLLEPIVSVMGETDDDVVKRRASDMLTEIRRGLGVNPSVSVRALLLFVHGHLESIGAKVREEREEKERADAQARVVLDRPSLPTGALRDRLKRAAEADNYLLPPDPRREAQKAPHAKRQTRLQLARMALALFHEAIDNAKLGTATEKQRALIEPFIAPLADAFRSSDNQLVSMAMACMGVLITRRVMQDGRVVARVLRRTFALIDRLPPTAAMFGDALHLLTTVIHNSGNVLALDGAQMSTLARFLSTEVESLTRINTTFALMRAVLRHRLPLPEIYSLMETVSQIAVRSEDESARRNARVTFVQFLATYPLADKAFGEHLAFVVSNMRQHEFESGRLSCLETMMLLFERLPPQLVAERAEFFFLPLVASLVGDEFPRCRAAAAEALRVLLVRIDAQRVGAVLGVALNWFGADGEHVAVANAKRDRLRATGAQALRLFGGGVLSVELEASVLAAVSRALRGAVDGLAEVMFENTANAHSVAALELQWPWLYHTLVALERFVTAPRDALQTQLRAGGSLHDVWSLASEFLLYPHAWVRRVACRVIGCCFALCARNDGGFASAPADVLRVVDALCAQLESPHLTDEHGEQVVKNLLVLMRHALALGDTIDARVNSLPAARRIGSALRLELTNDDAVKATVLSEAAADERDNDSGDENDGGDAESAPANFSRALRWVFVRTSFIARRGNPVQKTAVFKLFAAAVLQLGNDAVQPHLEPILLPLQREQAALEEARRRKSTARTAAHVVGELAVEVIGLLQSHVDAFALADAFNAVVTQRANRSSARKLALDAMDQFDPERAAKRRAVRQVRKRRRNRLEAQARRLRDVKFDAMVRGPINGEDDSD